MKKLFCINFTRWKQNYIHSFLKGYVENLKPIKFIANVAQADKKGFDSESQLITWASKNKNEVDNIIKKWGGVPWYIEDGFIRSAGLGTDLTAPASLVLDKTGIYYDPTAPSDLETILQNKEFTKSELVRAESLKNALIDNKLSKYNLGKAFTKDDVVSDLVIILIPGQVEDDASIKKGCLDISSNELLIQCVRKSNQDAFIIYKPHPDVVSGNRQGKVDAAIISANVDLELLDASITDCLDVADEVHTMTSLVGFEALMRDLKVVCYGLPFYSNWGLTIDRHNLSRRTRKLIKNELIAGTLIDYPLYMNWQTNQLTTPEVIVGQLKEQIDRQGGKQSNHVSAASRFMRKSINYLKGIHPLK